MEDLEEKNIFIVTSNFDKYEEIKLYLEDFLEFGKGFKILKIDDLHIQELQGKSVDIVRNKCEAALKFLKNSYLNNGIIIVEDTSFELNSMNGLPGPYIRDFFNKLGNKKLYELFSSFKNDSDESQEAIEESNISIYMHDQIINFNGQVKGKIVSPKNESTEEFKWNYFFIPEGAFKTYGQMETKEKNNFSARRIALDKLCKYLNSNGHPCG